MELRMGSSWTRDDIHDTFGGSKQAYLPSVKGEVVCGCFRKDLTQPHAPEEILVGTGPQRVATARQLLSQGNGIPCFVKEQVNEWEFVGHWRATSFDESKAAQEEATWRADRPVAGVLRLVRVD
jgi:hypothetical protein